MLEDEDTRTVTTRGSLQPLIKRKVRYFMRFISHSGFRESANRVQRVRGMTTDSS